MCIRDRLKIWMTPFASVAILEKLALLKIAFCKAPVLSKASWRRTSVMPSALPAAGLRMAESRSFADMRHLRLKNATSLAAWQGAGQVVGAAEASVMKEDLAG